jgi:hypothetical protein
MNKPIYQNNKILFSINAREKPKRQWIIGMIKKELFSQTLGQLDLEGHKKVVETETKSINLTGNKLSSNSSVYI